MPSRPILAAARPILRAILPWIACGLWLAPSACGEPATTVPGVVIDHLPAASRSYVGSPSIAILPSGEYLATHDLFGPGSTRDRTRVFLSTDRGRNWRQLGELVGQWWSGLFVHREAVYLMGVSREYGHVAIRRSTDSGRTWTTPRDAASGLLLADGKYHTAPVPVVEHRGRLWRAMEDAEGPGGWGSHFRSFVMSAPVDADLLRAESWTATNRLPRDPAWLAGKFGGWLEGNVVLAPQGRLVNLLRVDAPDRQEQLARVELSDDGRRASFDPVRGFQPFPGGAKKFSIRFDAASGRYWSLVNWVPNRHAGPLPAMRRNTLALVSSEDLRQWQVRREVVSHPDAARHGFQYADWLFDGPDIVAVVRTAHDETSGVAHNAHDANYLTFHRLSGVRP